MLGLKIKSLLTMILDSPKKLLLNNLENFEGEKSTSELEYSIHLVPKTMIIECLTVFPGLSADCALLCVPTIQKAQADLIDYTVHSEFEKNRLLQSFFEWGKGICRNLLDRGRWADLIDPCSGSRLL